MVRPRKNCRVKVDPEADFFKPRGIPLSRLECVALEINELEALRLRDLVGLSQEEAGNQMSVSRPTFGRILGRARQKVADALVHGKAIQIRKALFILSKEPPNENTR